jgi:uncharacterized membrane protein
MSFHDALQLWVAKAVLELGTFAAVLVIILIVWGVTAAVAKVRR